MKMAPSRTATANSVTAEANRVTSWADRGPGPWSIALLGAVAFFGVVALGTTLVSEFDNDAEVSVRARDGARIATTLVQALESTQRERGLAELAMGNNDGFYRAEHEAAMTDTDVAIDRSVEAMRQGGITPPPLTGLLLQARRQADSGSQETFVLYSGIVESLIARLSDLTALAADSEGVASRSAVIRLARAVEALGRRRAAVGTAIQMGTPFDEDLMIRIQTQSTEARREMAAAAALVNADLEPMVESLADGPHRELTSAMIEDLLAGSNDAPDVEEWRLASTAQMHEAKQAALAIDRAEIERLDGLEADARRNLAASAALLGVASLVSLLAAWAGFGASRERIRALREHEVLVDGLREWFVNEPLPAVAGLSIETLYSAADEYTRAGGDWTEVYPLADGQVILGVGDLVGHGSPAVAGMVMIKNMMRGQAVEGRRSLSAGIERLDQALAERGLLATLFYAVWDPIHSTLTWVSAGHVPVILRHPDGGVTMLEGGPSDSLIGLGDNVRRSTTETPVGPGTTLILYTDGLVEAPGVDIGEAIDELSRLQPEPGDRLIDTILAHRKDERDDVAILVAHW